MEMTVGIIGSGFGGLGTAIMLAQRGYKVTIYEKNGHCGGRANIREHDGFRFDMGPSWYLMPDVFERFFNSIGERIDDHLNLKKLDPSYTIFFKDLDKKVDITADLERDLKTFELLEPGVTPHFKKYLELSKTQYEIAMSKFVYNSYDSIRSLLSWDVFIKSLKLRVFSKMSTYVQRFFSTDEMQKIVEYPLLFLGTSPYDAPALYNIMSHVDFNMGVFYPMGGIYEIIKALVNIAKKYGVTIQTDHEVEKILTEGNKATGLKFTNGNHAHHDIIVSNADLRHTETQLIKDANLQSYPNEYRSDKILAPSAFIIYAGIEGKTPEMNHHNLIFCKDRKENFDAIFGRKRLPNDPSMYICVPSRTDDSVAPNDMENRFILVPIAPGLEISDEKAEEYYETVMQTIGKVVNIPHLLTRVSFKKIFQVKDFASAYNACQGTALGLAHTLRQSAIFRPKHQSSKLENLYYAGAYTNPGIGMPMCLISAQLVAEKILKQNPIRNELKS